MTSVERATALREANEKMRQYHMNRPPIEVFQQKKKQRGQSFFQDSGHTMQFYAVSAFLTAFLITPLLGRKIALDEDFRKKYVPSWYDFTIEKPEYAWTREELHEQYIQLQRDMHQRAIDGEFTPENLDKMRRHFAGVDPEEDIHGWGKLHPGVDEDEDVED